MQVSKIECTQIKYEQNFFSIKDSIAVKYNNSRAYAKIIKFNLNNETLCLQWYYSSSDILDVSELDKLNENELILSDIIDWNPIHCIISKIIVLPENLKTVNLLLNLFVIFFFF